MTSYDRVENRHGAVVHRDVIKMSMMSSGRERFNVAFSGEATGSIIVFHMKTKAEATNLVKRLIQWIECFNKIFVAKDLLKRETEYWESKSDLVEGRIWSLISADYVPLENGCAERTSCAIQNASRSLLSHACKPANLWVECFYNIFETSKQVFCVDVERRQRISWKVCSSWQLKCASLAEKHSKEFQIRWDLKEVRNESRL